MGSERMAERSRGGEGVLRLALNGSVQRVEGGVGILPREGHLEARDEAKRHGARRCGLAGPEDHQRLPDCRFRLISPALDRQ